MTQTFLTGLGSVFVVAVAAFATFLSTFLITLNNHSVAVCSLVFALYPAARIIADGRRAGWLFALCGFFSAFTVTNELPAFVFGAAMFFILLRQSPRLTLLWFVPAALIPLAGFFYTSYLASGDLRPFYAFFGTNVYEFEHQGIPSYWMQPQGIDAGVDPPLTYFLNCLIGHHGIFSLSPVFLLTVVGWVYSCRFREFPLRVFSLLGLALTVWMLIFIMLKTDNYGGNTAGLRWVFWLIPFWLIATLPVVDECGHKPSSRFIACCPSRCSPYRYRVPIPGQIPGCWTSCNTGASPITRPLPLNRSGRFGVGSPHSRRKMRMARRHLSPNFAASTIWAKPQSCG